MHHRLPGWPGRPCITALVQVSVQAQVRCSSGGAVSVANKQWLRYRSGHLLTSHWPRRATCCCWRRRRRGSARWLFRYAAHANASVVVVVVGSLRAAPRTCARYSSRRGRRSTFVLRPDAISASARWLQYEIRNRRGACPAPARARPAGRPFELESGTMAGSVCCCVSGRVSAQTYLPAGGGIVLFCCARFFSFASQPVTCPAHER